jgi:hypothetical protein
VHLGEIHTKSKNKTKMIDPAGSTKILKKRSSDGISTMSSSGSSSEERKEEVKVEVKKEEGEGKDESKMERGVVAMTVADLKKMLDRLPSSALLTVSSDLLTDGDSGVAIMYLSPDDKHLFNLPDPS